MGYNTKPVSFTYAGSKRGVLEWLHEQLPGPDQAAVMLEPFCGSAAFLLGSPRYSLEFINDMDSAITNFFQVLVDPAKYGELRHMLDNTMHSEVLFQEAKAARDDPGTEPIRRAWAFAACHAMSFRNQGSQFGYNFYPYGQSFGHDVRKKFSETLLDSMRERMRGVTIMNRCAMESIDAILKGLKSTLLIYCDPPYVAEVSSNSNYRHNSSDDMQERFLAKCIEASKREGVFIAISSYPNDLYDERLKGWKTADTVRRCIIGGMDNVVDRTERLYMNYDSLSPTLFDQ